MVSKVVFLVIMLILGLYFLIAGRFRISVYQGHRCGCPGHRARAHRGCSVYLYLFVHRGFLFRYSILIQAVVLLAGIVVLWFLAEKPARHQPLPAETHTFQSAPDEPPYRLHLRLLKDGSGLLVVNAATVLHLNATAAEFAFHMIKGTPAEETAVHVAKRYRISKAEAQKDYADFQRPYPDPHPHPRPRPDHLP